MPAVSRRLARFLAAVALLVAACALYGRAVESPFIYDDAGSVVSNASIRRLWPPVGDAEHPGALNPSGDLPVSGRPLVNLTLAVNYYLGELHPVGYHIFNVMMQALSAWLLMAVVRRTLELDYFEGRFQGTRAGALGLAFAVALLWSVHPLQTETVEYVTQRTELMVGFFYLATLYSSLRYWEADSMASRNTWLALVTLAALAGMACKEVMVTAPVMVLLFERTFIAGSFRRALKNSRPLYIALAASWGLLLWLNSSAPRSNTAGFHLGLPAYVWWFTQAKVFWMYLKLTVWPWPLAISYHLPYLTTLHAAWPWLMLTAFLAISTLILFWRRSAIGFLGAWILLILSPTFIVPIPTEVAAERRMYLPLAALVALAVAGGCALAQRVRRRSATADTRHQPSIQRSTVATTVFVALLLAVVLSVISFQRLAVYRDELSLWQDVLASQPKDFVAHYRLGLEFGREHRWQEALKEYEEAIHLNPDYPDSHNNLGNTLLELDRFPEAIACYQEALRLNPNYFQAHNNLGTALANLGKIAEAIDQYEEAISIKPDFVEAYDNLGKVLVKLDRSQEAVECYERALRYQPNAADAHAGLAAVFLGLGRFQEASDHYQRALEIEPDNPEARCNLGLALAKLGKPAEAIVQYQEALRLAPNEFHAHYSLGNLLFEAGEVPQAVEQFQQALRTDPDNAQAHYNLGTALLQIGQRDDAIQQLQAAVRLKPDYAESHNNLGSTLLRAGRPEEAIEQYQIAVQLMPNHPKPLSNLANAYAQMHRFPEAIAAAQKAVDLARSSGQADLAEQIETSLKNYQAAQAKPDGK